MTKKQELREEIGRIYKIYINAKENYQYCYYLHNPETKLELEYLAIDRHLKFLRHSLWRLTIIELAKLFSSKENDKFKLGKLISKFYPDGHYASVKIDIVKILEWESRIYSKELAIGHVINLRDKIYAHTDPKGEELKEVDLFFYDIDTLLDIAGLIIKDVYSSVFDSDVDLRTPIFDRSNFNLVKILAEHHKKKIETRFGNSG